MKTKLHIDRYGIDNTKIIFNESLIYIYLFCFDHEIWIRLFHLFDTENWDNGVIDIYCANNPSYGHIHNTLITHRILKMPTNSRV